MRGVLVSFKGVKVVALIPARARSKGIPHKNLRLFKGKPLVEHTINSALYCDVIDEIILSSDLEDILNVGRQMGIKTHLRSHSAADDNSTASQVLIDLLKNGSKSLLSGDVYIVYLQPTSPLRTSDHISAAFNLMDKKDVNRCVSVCLMTKSPFKSYILDSRGRLDSLFDEERTNANRQSLPVTYYPNGAIYIFLISDFLKKESFPTNGAVPFIMSLEDSIDIDTEQDLFIAEKLCRQN